MEKIIECKNCGATINLKSFAFTGMKKVKRIRCPFCQHITIIKETDNKVGANAA